MVTATDLEKYGIENVQEIAYNPHSNTFFAEKTKPGPQGFEKG